MAKKDSKASENRQNEGLTPEVSQDIQEAETRQEPPENAGEAGLVTYRVAAPRGIYLREGPGRAYLQLAVLPSGTEVMGVDLTGMLRADRKPGEAAWVKVLSKDGSGWVDSSFLERVC